MTLGTVASSYDGGAGNDSFSSTVSNLVSSGSYNTITGGEGNDSLTISDGAAATVTLVDNSFRAISGVENLTITSTTSGNQSITTGGWFDKAFASGVTLTTTASTGTITIDMSTFTGPAKITATTVGTTGTEGAISITTADGADTIVLSNATAGGNSTVITGAGADTITGGADVDSITGGKGADVIAGGGSSDVFIFAAGDSGLPSATNFDTITDFAAGDVIKYGSAMTIVTYSSTAAGTASISAAGVASFNAADVTFAQRLTAAENGINAGGTATAGQFVLFQYLSDAYLFISDGVDGIGANDVLIKLTGVDLSNAATDVATVANTNEITLG